jgi:predicted nucleic acid-binding Zn ribbon protein
MLVSRCPECGKEVPTWTASCSRCGRLLAASSARTAARRRGAEVGAFVGVGFVLMLVGLGMCFVSRGVGIFVVGAGIVIALAGRFI